MKKTLKLNDQNRKSVVIEFSEFIDNNYLNAMTKVANRELDDDTLEFGFWCGVKALWMFLLELGKIREEPREETFKNLVS
jgi:hypothetical protein